MKRLLFSSMMGLLLLVPVHGWTQTQGQTMYVQTSGLQLWLRADPQSQVFDFSLERGTAVVLEAQEGLFVKVRVQGHPAGWTYQFSLTPVKPETERHRRSAFGKQGMSANSGGRMASTAGALGVGPLAKAAGDAGNHTKRDEDYVDELRAFEPTWDLEEFLEEGRLGRYMFQGGTK